jgi:hypothetical protein
LEGLVTKLTEKSIKTEEAKLLLQKQLETQKVTYESKLLNSKNKINELMDKITDETKILMADEIKNYLAGIFGVNEELKQKLENQLNQKDRI